MHVVRAAVVLAWAALVVAVLTAVALGIAVRDAGVVVVVIAGVPVLCCAGGVAAARWRSWWGAPLVVAAAVVCLVWSLLNGPGLGLYLLPASVLLVAAAVLLVTGRLEERQGRRERAG